MHIIYIQIESQDINFPMQQTSLNNSLQIKVYDKKGRENVIFSHHFQSYLNIIKLWLPPN